MEFTLLCVSVCLCVLIHTGTCTLCGKKSRTEEVREEKGGNGAAHVPWPSLRNWFRTSMVTGAGRKAEGCGETAGRRLCPFGTLGDRMSCGAAEGLEGPFSFSSATSEFPHASVPPSLRARGAPKDQLAGGKSSSALQSS